MVEVHEVTRSAFENLASRILGHPLSASEISRLREWVVVRGYISTNGVLHSYDVFFPTCCMYDSRSDALDSAIRNDFGYGPALGIVKYVHEVWHIVDDPVDVDASCTSSELEDRYPDTNFDACKDAQAKEYCCGSCVSCPIEVVSDVTVSDVTARGVVGTFRFTLSASASDVLTICTLFSSFGFDACCRFGAGVHRFPAHAYQFEDEETEERLYDWVVSPESGLYDLRSLPTLKFSSYSAARAALESDGWIRRFCGVKSHDGLSIEKWTKVFKDRHARHAGSLLLVKVMV